MMFHVVIYVVFWKFLKSMPRELICDFFLGVLCGMFFVFFDLVEVNILLFLLCLVLLFVDAFLYRVYLLVPRNDKIKFIEMHPVYPWLERTFLISVVLGYVLLVSILIGSVYDWIVDFVVVLVCLFFVFTFRCIWILYKLMIIVRDG